MTDILTREQILAEMRRAKELNESMLQRFTANYEEALKRKSYGKEGMTEDTFLQVGVAYQNGLRAGQHVWNDLLDKLEQQPLYHEKYKK